MNKFFIGLSALFIFIQCSNKSPEVSKQDSGSKMAKSLTPSFVKKIHRRIKELTYRVYKLERNVTKLFNNLSKTLQKQNIKVDVRKDLKLEVNESIEGKVNEDLNENLAEGYMRTLDNPAVY